MSTPTHGAGRAADNGRGDYPRHGEPPGHFVPPTDGAGVPPDHAFSAGDPPYCATDSPSRPDHDPQTLGQPADWPDQPPSPAHADHGHHTGGPAQHPHDTGQTHWPDQPPDWPDQPADWPDQPPSPAHADQAHHTGGPPQHPHDTGQTHWPDQPPDWPDQPAGWPDQPPSPAHADHGHHTGGPPQPPHDTGQLPWDPGSAQQQQRTPWQPPRPSGQDRRAPGQATTRSPGQDPGGSRQPLRAPGQDPRESGQNPRAPRQGTYGPGQDPRPSRPTARPPGQQPPYGPEGSADATRGGQAVRAPVQSPRRAGQPPRQAVRTPRPPGQPAYPPGPPPDTPGRGQLVPGRAGGEPYRQPGSPARTYGQPTWGPRTPRRPPSSTTTTTTSSESDSSLLRSSGGMALGTLASRLTGFLSALMLAYAVGDRALGNAYNTANTLPNVVYNLMLGGILTSVVVPLLITAAKRDPDRGEGYFQRIFSLGVIALGAITLVATLGAALIVDVYASKLPGAEHHVTVEFAYFFIPQIFFYGMSALAGAILNARGRLAAPMWTPVINNIVVILVLLLYLSIAGFGRTPSNISSGEVKLLGVGTTLGIIAQTVALLPALARAGFRPRPTFGFRREEVAEIGRLAGWLAGYVVTTQVTFFTTLVIAGA